MVTDHDRIDGLFPRALKIVEMMWPRPPEGHGLKTTDAGVLAMALLSQVAMKKPSDEAVLAQVGRTVGHKDFRSQAMNLIMAYGRHVRHRRAGTAYVSETDVAGIQLRMDALEAISVRCAGKPASASTFDMIASATRVMPYYREDGYTCSPKMVRDRLAEINRELGLRRTWERARAGVIKEGVLRPIDGLGDLPTFRPTGNFQEIRDAEAMEYGIHIVFPSETCLLTTDTGRVAPSIAVKSTDFLHAHIDEVRHALAHVIALVQKHRMYFPALSREGEGVKLLVEQAYRSKRYMKLNAARIFQTDGRIEIEVDHEVVDRNTLIPRRVTSHTTPADMAGVRREIVLLVRDEHDLQLVLKGRAHYAAIPEMPGGIDAARHMIERIALNALTSEGMSRVEAVQKAVSACHQAGRYGFLTKNTAVDFGCGVSLRMESGTVRATVDLSEGVRWVKGALMIDGVVPDTLASAMVDQPLRMLVDHPWLEGLTIKTIRPGVKTLVAVTSPWMVAKGEKT